MLNYLSDFSKYFGAAILGLGGVSALSFALFRIFSEKWLNSKFEKQLTSFKHEQQKEIERLKFEIDSLMDRRLKLYNREFEILPDAWDKLFQAFMLTNALIAIVRTQPDLNSMHKAQLESFLQKCSFLDWQTEEIRGSSEKNQLYSKYEGFRQLSRAVDSINDCSMLLKTKGIFIQSEIKSKFDAVSKLISDTIFEYQSNLQLQLPYENRLHESLDAFPKTAPKLMDELESLLKKRLWNAETIIS